MARINEFVEPKTICAVCGEPVNRSDIGGWMFSPHDTHIPTLGICKDCLEMLGEIVKERSP